MNARLPRSGSPAGAFRFAPLLLTAGALLTTGCGGAAAPRAGQATRESPASTLDHFPEAARDRNADVMWRLLSLRTRARLGPTLADFRRRATGLERLAGAFTTRAGYAAILSEPLGQRVAVAAVARSG